MALPLEHIRTIELPSGRTVDIETCGEHHMGADHTEFVLSEPICGLRRFFSTNGVTLLEADKRHFYIHDSCMILRFSTDSWEVSHYHTPKKVFLVSAVIDVDGLALFTYGKKISNPLIIRDCDWSIGLGEASNGVFPSAYSPWVDEQKLLR